MRTALGLALLLGSVSPATRDAREVAVACGACMTTFSGQLRGASSQDTTRRSRRDSGAPDRVSAPRAVETEQEPEPKPRRRSPLPEVSPPPRPIIEERQRKEKPRSIGEPELKRRKPDPR